MPKFIRTPLICLSLATSLPSFAEDWDFEGVAAIRISENWLNPFDSQIVEIAPDTFDEFILGDDLDQIGWGAFLGTEWEISEKWLMQLGAGYDLINFSEVSGDVLGNADPQYNGIDYQYQLKHQRLNAEFKLLHNIKNWFPYVTASLGAAWNETKDYEETSTTLGELPRTDLFSGTTHTDMSFSIGVGIERALFENWRLGLGYLYTDAGDAVLTATRTGDQLEQEVHIQEILLQLNFIL